MRNRGDRIHKKKVVFKRRCRNRGIQFVETNKGVRISARDYFLLSYNNNFLKNTGKPCSCPLCSPGKVEDKAKYRLNKFKKSDIYE